MGYFHKFVLKSISSKLYRSIGLSVTAMILSFAVVFIGLTAVGTGRGSKNTSERMGADLIIVPEGCGESLEGILLTARKGYFYMDESVCEQVKQTEGIEKISAQTFLMTMEASCCDQLVQIVGIDIETDFTVSPWIERKYISSLKNGEVIVGGGIETGDRKTFQMFGKKYRISAVLDECGASMDATVFINRDEMGNLIQYAKEAGQGIIKDVDSEDISAIFVDVADREDVQSVAARLSIINGVDIVTSDEISSKLSAGLNEIYVIYLILILILVLVCALVLYIIHFITLNERKSEIVILRTMGLSRKKIESMLKEETFITSFTGSITGTGIGFLSFHLMYQMIKINTKIPFTVPLKTEEVLILLMGFIITAFLGPLCSLASIRRVCPEEVTE